MNKHLAFCILLLVSLGGCTRPKAPDFVREGVDDSPKSTTDPVQICLDQINIKKAQNSPVCAGQSATTSPIGNKPVANPSTDLPTTCLNGSLVEIKASLTNQINNCRAKSDPELNQTFQFGCKAITKRDYCLNATQQLLKIASLPKMTYALFVQTAAAQFDWYKSNGRPDNAPPFMIGDTQFTAYFNPTGIDASSVQSSAYPYAVYAAPPGLTYVDSCDPNHPPGCGNDPVTNLPYSWCIENPDGTASVPPTHEQIVNGALAGKGLELAWFKYMYDIESLMLEGSGALNLKHPDGTVTNVVLNYSGQNGQSNNLLGSVISCEGKKITGSWQSYYYAHPTEALTDTVHYNPSIIFYKDGTQYVGTDNIPVTPHATIATDPTSIPTGAVALFNIPVKGTTVAACNGNASTVAIAQDIGGAIKQAHVDRYTGVGPAAEAEANTANDPGLIYMAVPKGAGTPIRGCK